MYHKTEKEIMNKWKNSLEKPILSICCTTYNHEAYIAEAIDSFLMQATDFPFEILIRDDCSTDNTAKIIQEYHEKYPNIIKPIFEKENTFSKGIKPMPQLYKIAKGEYIALCEGDDYWTDKNKLQIQTTAMIDNPSVSLSFHPCSVLNNDGTIIESGLDYSQRIYKTTEVIRSDFHFIQTNTIIFKKESLKNLSINLHGKSPVGDVWLRIAASIPNGALCINKNMSIYRLQSTNSWSRSMLNISKQLNFFNLMIVSINDFDKYWDYKYSKDFNFYKNKYFRNVIKNDLINQTDKIIFLSQYKDDLDNKNRFLWYCIYRFPEIIQILKKLKVLIRGR